MHEPLTKCRLYSGIRTPRTARNSSEKSEPYGTEAYDFASRKYMQRDVEFEVDTIDKSGGFIGSLYVNKTENVALALVKEGLATIHTFSAESLPWARQLFDAEVRLPGYFQTVSDVHNSYRKRLRMQNAMQVQIQRFLMLTTNIFNRSGALTTRTHPKLRKQPLQLRANQVL